jgi:hypothetical protein
MRYKELVERKLEELGNLIRTYDAEVRRASSPHERNEIYNKVTAKLEEISTLINSEQQD